MSDFITPTVGRVVWYYPPEVVGIDEFDHPMRGEPLAAVIAKVLAADLVNLSVIDASGVSRGRRCVKLVQDSEDVAVDSEHCTWMPFQKGQARAQAAVAEANSKKDADGPVLAKRHATEHDLMVRTIAVSCGLPVDDGKLSFGAALEQLKAGARVARAGWNGRGMFVYLQDGSIDPNGTDAAKFAANYVNGVDVQLFHCGDIGTVTRMPCICMHAADGSTVTGWLASQTDMLAEDWMVVQ